MSTLVDNTIPPNPAPAQLAKNSRKRRARKEKTALTEPVDASPPTEPSPSDQQPTAVDSPTDPDEPLHIKNLQKALRNANKKLNATAKVDAILAENPGKSLDELVDSKIINADQKAQILKKPSLQESARSIEEQISQFEDYVKYYNGKQEKLVSEIDALKAAHEAELAAQVASAREAAREEAVASTREESEKEFSERLLTFSRFLAAVAHRRTKEDLSTPISKAFEAVLIQVFHGTEAAVADATKLIQGSKENIHMADGEALDVTYAQIKELSVQQVLETASATQAPDESAPPPQETDTFTNFGQSDHYEQADPSMIIAAAHAQPPMEHDQSALNGGPVAANYENSSFTPNSHVNGYADINHTEPSEFQTQPAKASFSAENAPVEQPVHGGKVHNDIPYDTPPSTAPLNDSEVPQFDQSTEGNVPTTDSAPRNNNPAGRGRGGRGRGFRGSRNNFRGAGGRGRGRGGGGMQYQRNNYPRNQPQQPQDGPTPQPIEANATPTQQW